MLILYNFKDSRTINYSEHDYQQLRPIEIDEEIPAHLAQYNLRCNRLRVAFRGSDAAITFRRTLQSGAIIYKTFLLQSFIDAEQLRENIAEIKLPDYLPLDGNTVIAVEKNNGFGSLRIYTDASIIKKQDDATDYDAAFQKCMDNPCFYTDCFVAANKTDNVITLQKPMIPGITEFDGDDHSFFSLTHAPYKAGDKFSLKSAHSENVQQLIQPIYVSNQEIQLALNLNQFIKANMYFYGSEISLQENAELVMNVLPRTRVYLFVFNNKRPYRMPPLFRNFTAENFNTKAEVQEALENIERQKEQLTRIAEQL